MNALEVLWGFLINIRAEYIALVSVIVTVIIFVFNRQAELRYKKYEAKKVQYVKVIDMLSQMYTGLPKNKKTGEVILTEATKQQFFDVGSSLLLYGSKKLYKQYIFFREFGNNPLIEASKYYDKNITIFIIAQMLVTIRKEVGLSAFNSISLNDSLAFFVNAVSNNPIEKRKASEAKYKICMLKLELFLINRIKFTFLFSLFNMILRPIGGVLYLCKKYLIMVPLGRLLIKLFPSWSRNVSNEDTVSASAHENDS